MNAKNLIRRSAGKIHSAWLSRRLPAIEAKLNFHPEEAVMIFSEPRGGSTWIAEVLRRAEGTAVLWEPFTGNEHNPFKRLGLHWRQNIPEEADWPELSKELRRCLGGRQLNIGNTYFERLRPSAYLHAECLIVKCVHANGMLPWITKQISFCHPPIYLLRHPFAVVASQRRHGAWSQQVLPFQLPDCPYDSIFREHADFLLGLTDFEEVMTANWCLSNVATLKHPGPNRWKIVFYEHLRSQPLDPLFHHFELTMPPETTRLAKQPSRTSRSDRPEALDAWQQSISIDTQDRMQRVLDYFGITIYSKGNPLPQGVAYPV